jgi:hypothetical protein
MKKSLIISAFGVGCLALAMSLTLAPKAQAAKPTNGTLTGQSIMVNLQAEGTFAIVQTLTYHYNQNTAATYFTNLWDESDPTVSLGNIHDTSNTITVGPSPIPVVESECTPTTSPPGPPAPDATELNPGHPGHHWVVGENQCNFLDGTPLTGATYTQDATASASCSYISKVDAILSSGPPPKVITGYKVTTTTRTIVDTYTYTYNITPIAPGQFDPLTAWDFIGSTGGDTALVAIDGQIAGESVNSTKQWARKYSFSLGEDITGRISRVQNLALYVNDVLVANPGSTVLHNVPGAQSGDPGAVDFLYTGNAGLNGHTELLYQTANTQARTILNTDDFAGNQDGGADGEALAWAIMDTVNLELGVGDYTVHFTGVVKDNSGLTDLPINVNQMIHVVHPGCGQ